jgi:hypothetical protein
MLSCCRGLERTKPLIQRLQVEPDYSTVSKKHISALGTGGWGFISDNNFWIYHTHVAPGS